MIDLKSIPDALKEGESWEVLDIDPDWIWVSHGPNDEINGILLAAPCHGLVFLWRIKMLPTAPTTALLRLLRRFIKDIRARGCLGYMVMLDLSQPNESELAAICVRAKGMFAPGVFSVMLGSATTTGHLGDGT